MKGGLPNKVKNIRDNNNSSTHCSIAAFSSPACHGSALLAESLFVCLWACVCCTLRGRKPAGKAVSRPLPCFDVVMLIKKRSFSANTEQTTQFKILSYSKEWGRKAMCCKGVCVCMCVCACVCGWVGVCVCMFCIYIHPGSEWREDVNCEFLLMFLCFVRLPDKHVGRGKERGRGKSEGDWR